MPATRFGYDEDTNIGLSTPYTRDWKAGGKATTEFIEAATTTRFTGILPLYDDHTCERITNLEGSGPMFDENWNTWRFLMERGPDGRDRAARQIVGWNARAIAALAGLPRDAVQITFERVHHAARDEWLATHGWRKFGTALLPVQVILNDLVAVIGTVLGGPSYGWIFAIIGVAMDPVLRSQTAWTAEETREREVENAALTWLNSQGIVSIDMDLRTLVRFVSVLQKIHTAQGSIAPGRWTLEGAQQWLAGLQAVPPVILIVDPLGNQITAPIGNPDEPVPGDMPPTGPGPGIAPAPAPATANTGVILVIAAAIAGLIFWG